MKMQLKVNGRQELMLTKVRVRRGRKQPVAMLPMGTIDWQDPEQVRGMIDTLETQIAEMREDEMRDIYTESDWEKENGTV